jgi:hypothetical protein
MRTSHDRFCHYELSLHNKKTYIIQNMTENIVAYFYFLTENSCVKRSLNSTFVELSKYRFVMQPLQIHRFVVAPFY